MIEIEEIKFFRFGNLQFQWPDITIDDLECVFYAQQQLFAQMMGWA